MRIGFVGLGNLGSKLAGSLLSNGVDLVVRDLDEAVVRSFADRGASSASSPKELAERCEVVITCLPSPAVCAEVMEAADGVLAGLGDGKVWLEMSTTDESEVRRLANLVQAGGAMAIECPVSGGLSSCRNRKHLDLLRRIPRGVRFGTADSGDDGTQNPAHGSAGIGFDSQGRDQLPRLGQPCLDR